MPTLQLYRPDAAEEPENTAGARIRIKDAAMITVPRMVIEIVNGKQQWVGGMRSLLDEQGLGDTEIEYCNNLASAMLRILLPVDEGRRNTALTLIDNYLRTAGSQEQISGTVTDSASRACKSWVQSL